MHGIISCYSETLFCLDHVDLLHQKIGGNAISIGEFSLKIYIRKITFNNEINKYKSLHYS